MISDQFSRFKNDEQGSATIESLLWMPMFFYLFILITDVSFIFFGQAQALRVIQDGNRAYSINRFETDAEASAFIQNNLRMRAPHATAQTTVSSGLIQTTASIPMSDLVAVGSIPGFVGSDITITSQHLKEF